MSTKKQQHRLVAYVAACLLTLGSQQGLRAESVSDDNSLQSRLKAFNVPDLTENKTTAPLKSNDKNSEAKKVKSAVKKPKAKVAKRRRQKRACYRSSAAIIRDRAESFQPSIRNSSRRYGVSEALIMSVITAESCFSQRARSPKNAQGLMQLIPATAKRFGVINSYIPSQNIKGGTRYLKFLLEKFSGNLHLTVAAYNAGEGAVDRYSGIPPYKETKEYVRRVMSVYRRLQDTKGSNSFVRKASGSVNRELLTFSKPRVNNKRKESIAFAKSTTGKGYFIKPDYQWKKKPKRVSRLYKVSAGKQGKVCRDVSMRKLRRNSHLVKRGTTMKRYYTSSQPKSLSAIARTTGVNLNLLLRMNRGASRYMVSPGTKILVWQCAR